MSGRPLIFHGNDVRPVCRLARGQVRVEYLLKGQPLGRFAAAWPHELRGHPDGMTGIRKLVAALPDEVQLHEAQQQPELPLQETRARAYLHAHFAAGIHREDEEK